MVVALHRVYDMSFSDATAMTFEDAAWWLKGPSELDKRIERKS